MMDAIAVPGLTGDEAKQMEQLLVERYLIEPLQTQENAGRSLAECARRLLPIAEPQEASLQPGLTGHTLPPGVEQRAIVVLAGRGPNGAVGLAAARHLLNWGADVQIICSYPAEEYEGIAQSQLQRLIAMGAPLAWAEQGWELPPCDLVIDAIIGCGLRGNPRGRARDLIQLANSTVAPILSLETPSGLDTESGEIYTPCVHAQATLSLGLPRRGLLAPGTETVRGTLFLGDVGIPGALWWDLGLEEIPGLFARQSVIELQVAEGNAWFSQA